MMHATDVQAIIRTDGDFDAKVIRIKDTGAANTNYPLVHELGRIPVGIQVISSDKAQNVYRGTRWNSQTVDLKFTAANADVNIRIW